MKNSVVETIGNTPLIRLLRSAHHFGVEIPIFAKLEYFNPGGSIKDRPALYMIKEALKTNPGIKNLAEPTSGNTGIALAMIGNVFGIKTTLVMPENASMERIKILRLLGAEVILTPASEGMRGALDKAKELVEERKAFMPNQFENPANPKSHYETTGPEILKQVRRLCYSSALPRIYFVAGVGTGGTLMGVGKFLKEKIAYTRVIAVEPESSAVLSGKKPGSHRIQGIGAGFIPKIVDRNLIDRVITVKDEEAFEAAKILSEKDGVLSGISGGANFVASVKLARELEKDDHSEKTIVTVIPDSSFKYLSLLD